MHGFGLAVLCGPLSLQQWLFGVSPKQTKRMIGTLCVAYHNAGREFEFLAQYERAVATQRTALEIARRFLNDGEDGMGGDSEHLEPSESVVTSMPARLLIESFERALVGAQEKADALADDVVASAFARTAAQNRKAAVAAAEAVRAARQAEKAAAEAEAAARVTETTDTPAEMAVSGGLLRVSVTRKNPPRCEDAAPTPKSAAGAASTRAVGRACARKGRSPEENSRRMVFSRDQGTLRPRRRECP